MSFFWNRSEISWRLLYLDAPLSHNDNVKHWKINKNLQVSVELWMSALCSVGSEVAAFDRIIHTQIQFQSDLNISVYHMWNVLTCSHQNTKTFSVKAIWRDLISSYGWWIKHKYFILLRNRPWKIESRRLSSILFLQDPEQPRENDSCLQRTDKTHVELETSFRWDSNFLWMYRL